MLESISIKNIALIDEAFIEFSEGLNVLTGETGAGKSMIIDSLGFALGEKTSRDIIRSGEKTGKVEAVFYITDKQAIGSIIDDGIELDDGTLIITRSINDAGKSSARVNGQAVTTQTLKKITGELLDVHGQHEHQSLLNPSKQLDFVDSFCGDTVEVKKKALALEFRRYKEINEKIREIEKKANDKESRLDFLEYRIAELEAAKLKPGEEEALSDEKRAVSASDKLFTAINTALGEIYEGGAGKPALDAVSEALSEIEPASAYDKRLEIFTERLYAVREEINDISQELRRYLSYAETDPGRIDKIEERLNEIYIIKRKYGGTVGGALDSLEKMINERNLLSESEFELEKLKKELDKSYAAVTGLCSEISTIRMEGSSKMEKLISSALKDLSMEDASFSVAFSPAEISQNGADRIELLLSANKGEPPKPLAKIASGGEMSRVMLAVKSVAASLGGVETFIFDEIDQGTSGRTAQKVAEKMALLAGNKQLICITHLPQIAAMADRHILIEKQTVGGKTFTKTRLLDENDITGELGRLLGGAEITEQTIKAAAEMRELAKKVRKKR